MALRQIRVMGDDILLKKSKEVTKMTDRTMELIGDMKETLYDANGVGLAAPQVGVLKRIVVIDTTGEDMHVMINPKIKSFSEERRIYEEGCLSIPDVRIEIERPSEIVVGYIDRDGKPKEMSATGLLATAIQHEVDHLNGRLIIDFLSRLKRDIIIRRFRKQAKGDAPQA